MKIIFMGSPDFAIPALEKLYNSNHEVIAVYTQLAKQAARGMKILKSKIHQKAEELGIPAYTPKSLKDENEQKIFSDLKPDCAVVAAYGLLLPKPILEAPKWGCINIHPSKLPRWRGAAPIQRAIMAGDSETSVCIMQMEEGLDSGGIYAEKLIDVPDKANAGFMHDLLANEGADLLLEVVNNIEKYSAQIRKQTEEGLVYAKKIKASEEIIDFSKSCVEIYNQIRGLSPYPAAYFINKGIKYKVFDAEYEFKTSSFDGVTTEVNLTPESCRRMTASSGTLKIQCADGFIIPIEIQKEGKKRMLTKEFLKGNSFE